MLDPSELRSLRVLLSVVAGLRRPGELGLKVFEVALSRAVAEPGSAAPRHAAQALSALPPELRRKIAIRAAMAAREGVGSTPGPVAGTHAPPE